MVTLIDNHWHPTNNWKTVKHYVRYIFYISSSPLECSLSLPSETDVSDDSPPSDKQILAFNCLTVSENSCINKQHPQHRGKTKQEAELGQLIKTRIMGHPDVIWPVHSHIKWSTCGIWVSVCAMCESSLSAPMFPDRLILLCVCLPQRSSDDTCVKTTPQVWQKTAI